MSDTAQDRGWGPHGGLSGTDLVRLACPGIPLRVRAEVAPLFAELVRWLTAERAKAGTPALSSSGGYNDRPIAGSTAWSNHAWGLAVDFNAGANPRSHTYRSDMPPGTSAKAASLGMRWGGDYTPPTKYDPMHFEFMGTPADAKARVAALAAPHVTAHPPTVQEDDMSRTSTLVIVDGTKTAWEVFATGTRRKAVAGFLTLLSDAEREAIRHVKADTDLAAFKVLA